MKKVTQLDAAWLVVLLCYCAVFGGILLYSNFLPYTFDNNESFSAFWHARNMYEYGIANSSGLADESFSYDAAAHPYVYTHAGASPRLFAYLLYVLGFRTVELQIAVTIFTIGVLGFWFAYRFLAEISSRLYATVACLLLMTDYIMFAQWHFSVWHTWKMFLLFGGLYLAQRVAVKKQAYPLLMVYAFHAFLFYYETIFNVYVAAAVFLYFVFASRDYHFAVKFGVAQFAGALTVALILLGQLVLQFGWDVVRTDIYYTFIGRNFATDVATFLEAAKAFYLEHNIVFWLNVPDSTPYRNLLWGLRFLFQDHGVHTPPWSLVVLAFAAAEVVRRLRAGQPSAAAVLPTASKLATVCAAFVLGALTGALFYILRRRPEIGAGLASPFSIYTAWLVQIGFGILAAAVIFRRTLQARAFPRLRKFFASIKLLVKHEAGFALAILAILSAVVIHFLSRHPEIVATLVRSLPVVIGGGILFGAAVAFAPSKLFGRLLGACAFVAAVLAFVLMQASLYSGMGNLEVIWQAALVGIAGYTTGGAFFVSVMLLFAAWYASGPAVATDWPRRADPLLLTFAALLLAYLFVFFVFTGYIFTGYFARYLSLTIFLNDLFLALGLVAMIECVRGWYDAVRESTSWRRLVQGGGAAVATIGVAGAVLYWGSLQTFLLRKLPPNEISFFSILSKPPFRGATFAGSIYGGTLAYFSKSWAYFDADSALAEGSVTLGPDGYEVKRDDAYVWFADRTVNGAYDKPQYFLAMTFMYDGLMHGRGPGYLMDDEDAPRPRAGDIPLIRAVREGRTSYLHPVEVARDPSPLDRWSIVQMDWDYPPFLRLLQGGEFVVLHAQSIGDRTRIRVDYHYAQQEGVPEAGTRITLFTPSQCGGSEQDTSVPLSHLVDGTREFDLPRSFSGTVRAEVQPATATKAGPVYASRPLQIGSQATCPQRTSIVK